MIYEIIGFILTGVPLAALFSAILLDMGSDLDLPNFISWMIGYFILASMVGTGIYFISLAQ